MVGASIWGLGNPTRKSGPHASLARLHFPPRDTVVPRERASRGRRRHLHSPFAAPGPGELRPAVKTRVAPATPWADSSTGSKERQPRFPSQRRQKAL